MSTPTASAMPYPSFQHPVTTAMQTCVSGPSRFRAQLLHPGGAHGPRGISCAHRRLATTACLEPCSRHPGLAAGETLPNASVRDLGALLKDNGYEVFLRNGSLYGFKGISGRFAPIAVHVSLILILFGAAVGALGGLDGQARPPGKRYAPALHACMLHPPPPPRGAAALSALRLPRLAQLLALHPCGARASRPSALSTARYRHASALHDTVHACGGPACGPPCRPCRAANVPVCVARSTCRLTPCLGAMHRVRARGRRWCRRLGRAYISDLL